jgi:hypothetical protein
MAVLSESSPLRAVLGRYGSTLACALLVLAVVAGAAVARSLALAVWLLSFWHYALYWLACAFGVPAFDVFKRDAVFMKTVAVAALAAVYLSFPLDLVSLAVIAGGILLNMRAAAALGIDRTYYGHEVAGLPPRRITAFPYSLTSHPMILGNVAAFGGTLLNAPFRQEWWPLAGLHVALNIGLLVMELAGDLASPQRRRAVRIGGSLAFMATAAACVFAVEPARGTAIGMLALLGLAAIACAWTLYRCYARPDKTGWTTREETQ